MLLNLAASQQAVADHSLRAISFGAASCSDVTRSRSSGSSVLDHATTWAEGYLSAQNPDAPEWVGLVESTLNRGQREDYMYSYCKQHPQAVVLDASQELQKFLESELVGRAKRL